MLMYLSVIVDFIPSTKEIIVKAQCIVRILVHYNSKLRVLVFMVGACVGICARLSPGVWNNSFENVEGLSNIS